MLLKSFGLGFLLIGSLSTYCCASGEMQLRQLIARPPFHLQPSLRLPRSYSIDSHLRLDDSTPLRFRNRVAVTNFLQTTLGAYIVSPQRREDSSANRALILSGTALIQSWHYPYVVVGGTYQGRREMSIIVTAGSQQPSETQSMLQQIGHIYDQESMLVICKGTAQVCRFGPNGMTVLQTFDHFRVVQDITGVENFTVFPIGQFTFEEADYAKFVSGEITPADLQQEDKYCVIEFYSTLDDEGFRSELR